MEKYWAESLVFLSLQLRPAAVRGLDCFSRRRALVDFWARQSSMLGSWKCLTRNDRRWGWSECWLVRKFEVANSFLRLYSDGSKLCFHSFSTASTACSGENIQLSCQNQYLGVFRVFMKHDVHVIINSSHKFPSSKSSWFCSLAGGWSDL